MMFISFVILAAEIKLNKMSIKKGWYCNLRSKKRKKILTESRRKVEGEGKLSSKNINVSS